VATLISTNREDRTMTPPDHRLPGEQTFVLVLLLFGLTALWQSFRISGLASWSSPGAVPMLAALVLVVSGLKVALSTLRKPPPEIPPESSLARSFGRRLMPRVVIAFTLLIVLYMFSLEPLGFIISSFLFLVAGMWALGSRRLGYNALISAVSLAAIYVTFQTAFSVVLPDGVLKGVL
jgi:putative tricarboxylic transport membrane protein